MSATAGCAHFREAHERAVREQGDEQPRTPVAAQAVPIPPAPYAAPAPKPPTRSAPLPALPAQVAATPAPVTPAAPQQHTAQDHKADVAAQKAERAQDRAQHKATRRAEKQQAKSQLAAKPATTAPIREPVFETPAQTTPVPAPVPTPALPTPVAPPMASMAPAPMAVPGKNTAIVMFSNTPGTHCGACETVKLSVAPSGQVLIERGHFDNKHDWRYKRSVAHVTPERAAAFAARLGVERPMGEQTLPGSPACAAPATSDDGLVIDWIEAGRRDRLTVTFACTAQRNSQMAASLRQAPDLLGLHQLSFPWSGGQ